MYVLQQTINNISLHQSPPTPQKELFIVIPVKAGIHIVRSHKSEGKDPRFCVDDSVFKKFVIPVKTGIF